MLQIPKKKLKAHTRGLASLGPRLLLQGPLLRGARLSFKSPLQKEWTGWFRGALFKRVLTRDRGSLDLSILLALLRAYLKVLY